MLIDPQKCGTLDLLDEARREEHSAITAVMVRRENSKA